MNDELKRIAERDQLWASMETFTRITTMYLKALQAAGFPRNKALRLMMNFQVAMFQRSKAKTERDDSGDIDFDDLENSLRSMADSMMAHYEGLLKAGLEPEEAMLTTMSFQTGLLTS